jgi:hypothetical protein
MELPQAPSEEKPKRAGGKKPKPESPVAALAQAHPHLKGLLHFAGQTLPKVAQPLAAKAPGVLVGAAPAARKYGRGQSGGERPGVLASRHQGLGGDLGGGGRGRGPDRGHQEGRQALPLHPQAPLQPPTAAG